MGHERDQDGWLGVTLRQSPATAPDACPDAETLAAWADGGLDAKATASVDLHASACSRCMAVLAAMERTAPAAPARHAWTPARLFRWLAPLAAAATAVAIWIAVPDRPTVPVVPAPAQDFQASRELGTANPAPSTKNPEPRESAKSASEPERQLRDDFKRERAESAIGATAAAAPAAPSAQEAPATAAAADALAGSAAPTALRSALNKTAPPAESAAPSNPLIRWRVVASTSIEPTG